MGPFNKRGGEWSSVLHLKKSKCLRACKEKCWSHMLAKCLTFTIHHPNKGYSGAVLSGKLNVNSFNHSSLENERVSTVSVPSSRPDNHTVLLTSIRRSWWCIDTISLYLLDDTYWCSNEKMNFEHSYKLNSVVSCQKR